MEQLIYPSHTHTVTNLTYLIHTDRGVGSNSVIDLNERSGFEHLKLVLPLFSTNDKLLLRDLARHAHQEVKGNRRDALVNLLVSYPETYYIHILVMNWMIDIVS